MPHVSLHISVVEYIGTSPGRHFSRKHKGKQKKSYIRIKENVKEEILEQLTQENVKRWEICTKDLTMNNEKQLRNLKYSQNKVMIKSFTRKSWLKHSN